MIKNYSANILHRKAFVKSIVKKILSLFINKIWIFINYSKTIS